MTHTRAFIALLVLVAAFFAPIIVRGDVVFPHDNSIEVGLEQEQDPRGVPGFGKEEITSGRPSS